MKKTVSIFLVVTLSCTKFSTTKKLRFNKCNITLSKHALQKFARSNSIREYKCIEPNVFIISKLKQSKNGIIQTSWVLYLQEKVGMEWDEVDFFPIFLDSFPKIHQVIQFKDSVVVKIELVLDLIISRSYLFKNGKWNSQ